ncbi:MAG TPA: site-2 protease family protein [Blastocatellia bacterium]|nr:site-2 protease family protein [Blastocatellia bacterium]
MTWLVVFTLVTLSLVSQFSGRFPNLPGGAQIGISIIASLLFFASILFHEMAHSLLAIRYGQPVRAITLFVFGGVSEIEREPEQPKAEIEIALVGPISSYLLGLGFGAIWYLGRESMPIVGAIAGWLSVVNLALGTFNLLPGLPLDGGRVLRGVIWRLTGDQMRATRISSRVGKGFGHLLVLLGIWAIFYRGDLANGIWLGLIGLFLVNAAGTSLLQVKMQRALTGVRANQAMATDCPYIPAGISLKEFVDRFLSLTGRRCFVVGELESPRGVITPSEVRAIPREEWPKTSVQAAMRPWDQVDSVEPDTGLEDVVRLIDLRQIPQVAVVEGGKLLGIIEHESLLRFIRNRMELAA